MPEGAVEKHEKTDKIPYREWARNGWLTITEGDVTDYARLEDQIRLLDGSLTLEMVNPQLAAAMRRALHYAIGNGWQVHEICYDSYNATHFKNEMDDFGYKTIEVPQTMKALNEPTKYFRDDLVEAGKLEHDGSPLFAWCAGNAVQIVDTKENIMLSKKNAKDTRRIDLMAATLDALYEIQSLQNSTSYADYVKSDDFGY